MFRYFYYNQQSGFIGLVTPSTGRDEEWKACRLAERDHLIIFQANALDMEYF